MQENELILSQIRTLSKNEVRMSTLHKRKRGKCSSLYLLLIVPLRNEMETRSLEDLLKSLKAINAHILPHWKGISQWAIWEYNNWQDKERIGARFSRLRRKTKPIGSVNGYVKKNDVNLISTTSKLNTFELCHYMRSLSSLLVAFFGRKWKDFAPH